MPWIPCGNPVEATLRPSATGRHVHRATGTELDVGHGHRSTRGERFPAPAPARAITDQFDGEDAPVRPVRDEEPIAPGGREQAVACERHADGARRIRVDDRGKRVDRGRVQLGAAGSPAEVAAFDQVQHARGAVPRRTDVPLHVAVVGHGLAIDGEVDVACVAHAARHDLAARSIGRASHQHAARSHDAMRVAARIPLTLHHQVFRPVAHR